MRSSVIVLMVIVSTLSGSLCATIDEDLISASIVGNVQEIQRLLAAGANANANIFVQGSPLCMASGWGKVDAMRTLLAAGADPNLAIYPGNRVPLSSVLYAFRQQGMINRNVALQAAVLLLERGANVSHIAVQQALKSYPDLNEFLQQADKIAKSKLH